jgi:hypothetical protein
MNNSENSSSSGSTTGSRSTQQIRNALARSIRNETDYDDWDYGTEPIERDTTWVQPASILHLYARLLQRFQEEETVSHARLAALAVTEILTIPPETLLRLAKTFTP